MNTRLILTANERLAREYKQQFADDSTTLVLHLKQFAHECWWDIQDTGYELAQARLLSDVQTHYLWEKVISSLDISQDLPTSNLAKQVKDAYSTYLLWELDSSLWQSQWVSLEVDLFLRAAKTFDLELKALDATTYEHIFTVLTSAFKDRVLKTYTHIELMGFTELAPVVEKFIAQASHYWKKKENPSSPDKKAQLLCYNSYKDELVQAALWAKTHHEKKPESLIALIIPSLSRDLDRVKRIFQQVFTPEKYLHYHDDSFHCPYNLSSGTSLDQQPIVQDIFFFAEFAQKTIDKYTAINALHSPFWQYNLSTLAPTVITWINKQSNQSLSTFQLIKTLHSALDEELDIDATSSKAYALIAMRESVRNRRFSRFVEWRDWLKEQLKNLGWPGERPLCSEEYQAIKLFFDTLEKFNEIDSVNQTSTRIPLETFLKEFKTLLQGTVYHPQTQPSNIQIMGLMEGAGLKFDICRIVSMDDRTLPAQPNINPFLPAQVQRDKNTPKSTHQKEFDYASELIGLYEQHAKDVTYSFHLEGATGENHPSPVRSFQIFESDGQTNETPIEEIIRHHANQHINEPYQDSQAPRYDTRLPLQGGTGHLKLFAINPLYAFLYYQLNAKPPADTEIGLTALDRGNLTHSSLYYLWKGIKDQQTLKKLSQQEREALIQQSVFSAFNDYRRIAERLTPPYMELIKTLIARQIEKFIELELQRSDFAVIALEKPITLHLNELTINMTLDRIDQLGDKSSIILDYKTGKTTLSHLYNTPLLEPQLPLYALSNDIRVQGIGFGEISAQRIGFFGIGNDIDIAGFEPTSKARSADFPKEWSACIDWWKTHLNDEAAQLVEGYAVNETRYRAQASFYDFLKPLARH